MSLVTGPEITVSMESLSADQVDNSVPLLRKLSPFVIQLEPPSVFQYYNNDTQQMGLYSSANQTVSNYQQARKAISNSDLLNSASQTTMNPEDYYVEQSYAFTGGTSLFNPGADLKPVGKPALPDYLGYVDISLQINSIMKTPPLVLLINPTSFQIQYAKIQQYQDRSRYGYILHMWGEDQAKISFTARCGAFISGGKGVHVASRNDSKSWQNMQELMMYYKNNGYIYDTMGKSNAHLHVGALSIRYDGFIYYGSMESFQFELNESNELGGVEFSIEFIADGIMDTTPNVYQVAPLKSPVPSIEDSRYMDDGNGVNKSHNNKPPVQHQGGLVEQDNSINAPGQLKQGLGVVSDTSSVVSSPVGDLGFQGANILITKDVNQDSVIASKPFGF